MTTPNMPAGTTTVTGDLITGFYRAFAERNHAVMAAAYLPAATFADPVFGTLNGWRIGAMWRMLCERATDLTIAATDIRTDGARGSAHWEARYTFSATGHHVHNVIEATFQFESGKILSHVDRFSLYRWSSQALGMRGVLLGWSPLVQNAVRKQAARGLEQFITRNNLGPPIS